jgi:hypothetical protein
MGRGLGERQRELLGRLRQFEKTYWVPLHKLVDDPDDHNEMAKVRSAARGLERRGLVQTITWMADEDRLIDTTVISYENFRGWEPVYEPLPGSRTWVGMHVHLLTDTSE